MNYFVFYVKDSEPKVKSFETLGKARTFVDNFKSDLENGYWVEHIIKGEFIEFYDGGLHVLSELKKCRKK